MTPPGPFDRAQILILSSIEWSAAWQRHQAFASQWAAAGHEVFFVENTGFRDPSASDLPRLSRRVGRLLSPASRRVAVPEGIRLVNPLVLPPRRPGFQRLNKAWFVPMIVDRLRAAGLRDDVVAVAYLPTRTTLQILDAVAPRLTVYDCVDNFHGHPDPPPDLDATEAELLRRSGLVLTTSRTLFEEKSKLHPNVVELHHGAAPSFFLPPRPPNRPRRLCYFGTLWRAVDYAPLRALGEAGYAVDLIGPRKEPLPPLPAGVTWRPAVAHEELPGILAGYDALLLPYVDDEYNRGVIPAKVYECLATGRPVIASPLPALSGLGGVLTLARDPRAWVSAAGRLEDEEAPERRAARVAAARAQSREANFAKMRALVTAAWERSDEPPATPAGGAHVRSFVRGFSWIGLLYGLAKTSTLLTQVAAGRILGPREYGQANLVIAAAAYLQIVPLLGFPVAISRFLGAAHDDQERRGIVSTGLLSFAGWAAAGLGLLLLLRAPLARALGVPAGVLDWALAFAFATAVYTVVSSPLLGLKRFRERGTAEIVYGAVAPAALLLLAGRHGGTHRQMIGALTLALLAGALYAAWALRSYARPKFDASVARSLVRFAAMASLNLLATAFILAPARLILNGSHSQHEVGLFSAYFTSTVQVALAVLYMVTAVVVPVASTGGGQEEGWRAFGRLRMPLGLGAWAGFALAASAALALFGRQYAFHPLWLALFSCAAALVLVHGVTAALYAARDFSGLRVSAAGSLAAGLGNAALAWALIPRFGITGAALALVGGFAAGLATYAGARRMSL